MTRSSRTSGRVAALAAGTALSLSGVLLGAPLAAADADEVIVGEVSGLDSRDINPDARGSLTLIKSEPNPYDDRDGQKPYGPVDGIIFEAELLDCVDLGDPDVLSQLADVKLQEASSDCGVVHTYSAVTDRKGDAVIRNIPVGMYRVTEQPGAHESLEYRTSDSFLVTVPVGRTGDWSYDVQLWPKPGDPDTPLTETPSPGPDPSEDPSMTPPPTQTPTSTPTASKPADEQQAPPPPPEDDGPRGALASTGAQVATLIGVGAALVVAGIFVARKNRVPRHA